jgi:hypothetical protein
MGEQHVSHPSQQRHPPELEERVVRLVQETVAESGASLGVAAGVTNQLDIRAACSRPVRSSSPLARTWAGCAPRRPSPNLCDVDPIRASLGRTSRPPQTGRGSRCQHRAANDRRAPAALLPAVAAYAGWRTADRLSSSAILRCLKHDIAREVFHSLRVDLAALNAAWQSGRKVPGRFSWVRRVRSQSRLRPVRCPGPIARADLLWSAH